jgi:hypothetical protein
VPADDLAVVERHLGIDGADGHRAYAATPHASRPTALDGAVREHRGGRVLDPDRGDAVVAVALQDAVLDEGHARVVPDHEARVLPLVGEERESAQDHGLASQQTGDGHVTVEPDVRAQLSNERQGAVDQDSPVEVVLTLSDEDDVARSGLGEGLLHEAGIGRRPVVIQGDDGLGGDGGGCQAEQGGGQEPVQSIRH